MNERRQRSITAFVNVHAMAWCGPAIRDRLANADNPPRRFSSADLAGLGSLDHVSALCSVTRSSGRQKINPIAARSANNAPAANVAEAP